MGFVFGGDLLGGKGLEHRNIQMHLRQFAVKFCEASRIEVFGH